MKIDLPEYKTMCKFKTKFYFSEVQYYNKPAKEIRLMSDLVYHSLLFVCCSIAIYDYYINESKVNNNIANTVVAKIQKLLSSDFIKMTRYGV